MSKLKGCGETTPYPKWCKISAINRTTYLLKTITTGTYLFYPFFFLKYILLPSDFCLHDPLLHGIPVPAWHEDSGKEPNSSPTNL